MSSDDSQLVLGLDLGSNSIGWALVALESGKPSRLADMGVRCFEAGVEGDIEKGMDESRAAARRGARLQRRQIWRRTRRKGHVARVLQHNGMLPKGKLDTDEQRLEFFTEMDKRLAAKMLAPLDKDDPERRRVAHVGLYMLRARALDEKLELYELGRALFHLSQRRGFKSNRRAVPKKDEDQGVVDTGIGELREKMAEAGARTLGEYFSKLDPEQERIRSRWTSRKMYETEFDLIWQAQAKHYPKLLTDELKKIIHTAIFFQRPLKSQKGLVGRCEYERGARRAPKACIEFQQYRIWQKINDLEIISLETGEARRLDASERDKLAARLERHKEVTFAGIRKELGLKKKLHQFNLERGGEKNLKGNDTVFKMLKVFGERWFEFSTDEQERIIDDLRSIRKDEHLKERAIRVWGLDAEQAETFAKVSLEEGYGTLSRKALRKILPEMKKGRQYMEVVKEIYEDRAEVALVDFLPALKDSHLVVLNPAVIRALTELRKVVNGIIRRHGTPDIVRIELARDLKRSRQERKKVSARMRKNEDERRAVLQRIEDETGMTEPSGGDRLKVRLANECNWRCPYTGRSINMHDLIGPESQFDIEHIIPYSKCLDDSMANKTLCWHEENRNVKGNRTPFEAYGSTEQYSEILQRVADFKGPMRETKMWRFRIEDADELEDFSARQLNDTRYISTLAAKYLSMLYGGLWDADGKRRIQTNKGGVTARLRDCWDLNSVLGDGGAKERTDHRHHAVDAVAIALTDARTAKLLGKAADTAWEKGQPRRLRRYMPQPWDGFLDDVRAAVDNIVVSHRVSRKVNGPLHQETLYSHRDGREYLHYRKLIKNLSKPEVSKIVDDRVREIVTAALDGDDPKKVFAEKGRRPYLETRDGRRIPINKVRLAKKTKAMEVGQNARARHVLPGSNHHVEIFETADGRWKGKVVSRFEAMQRVRSKQPVVQRDHGEGNTFKFSLAINDTVSMKDNQGNRDLYRVQKLSVDRKGQILLFFIGVNDARQATKIPASGRSRTPGTLGTSECEKVSVTPLGDVRLAND